MWPPELAAADLHAALGTSSPVATGTLIDTLTGAQDVYAVGCLAYEMLAPTLPLNRVPSTADVLRRIAAGTAHAGGDPSFCAVRENPAVAAVWLWATAAAADDRPSAGQLRSALAEMTAEYVILRAALRAESAARYAARGSPGHHGHLSPAPVWPLDTHAAYCIHDGGGADDPLLLGHAELLKLGRAARVHAPSHAADAVVAAASITRPGELLSHPLCGLVDTARAQPSPLPFAGPLPLELALWLDRFTQHVPLEHGPPMHVCGGPACMAGGRAAQHAHPIPDGMLVADGVTPEGVWGQVAPRAISMHVGGGAAAVGGQLYSQTQPHACAPRAPRLYPEEVQARSSVAEAAPQVCQELYALERMWAQQPESGCSSDGAGAQHEGGDRGVMFAAGPAGAAVGPMHTVHRDEVAAACYAIAAAVNASSCASQSSIHVCHALGAPCTHSSCGSVPVVWQPSTAAQGHSGASHMHAHCHVSSAVAGLLTDDARCWGVPPAPEPVWPPVHPEPPAPAEDDSMLSQSYRDSAMLWQHVAAQQAQRTYAAGFAGRPYACSPPAAGVELDQAAAPEEPVEWPTLHEVPAGRPVFDTCGISSDLPSTSGSSALGSSGSTWSGCSSSAAAAAFGRMVQESASAVPGHGSGVAGADSGWGEAWVATARPRRHLWQPQSEDPSECERQFMEWWERMWRAHAILGAAGVVGLGYSDLDVHGDPESEGIGAAGPGFFSPEESALGVSGTRPALGPEARILFEDEGTSSLWREDERSAGETGEVRLSTQHVRITRHAFTARPNPQERGRHTRGSSVAITSLLRDVLAALAQQRSRGGTCCGRGGSPHLLPSARSE